MLNLAYQLKKLIKLANRQINLTPLFQALVDKYNKDNHLINKDLSSVQNRKLEPNQTMENAQFDKINTTHNKGKTVSTFSIVSDSDHAIARKPLVKLKLKKLKKHKSGLKKKNNMQTAHKTREEKITKTYDENIMVKGTIKCILSFISGFFNLLNTIFNNSPGILWGINLVLIFQTAMSQGYYKTHSHIVLGQKGV